MPQDPAERPATIDEVISAVAKANGVAPALALAVANRESKLDPNAVGDGGKAIGLFQLHPAAAQDTATADRSDPFQNITGGVKYLKQLSDKYQGDVSKVLQAYNGGMEGVDAGTVSPAAQAYAADVLASLSAGARPNKAAPAVVPAPLKPVASHAPTSNYQDQKSAQYGINLHTTEPEKKPDTYLQQLGKTFDPRTTEGRINLASGAAAGAFTYATAGAGAPEAPAVGAAVARGVLPWIVRVIGPPTVAGLTAAGTMATEKALGTAPKDSDSIAKTGVTQAAYEVFGQTLGWGIRRLAGAALGTQVGKASKAYLDTLSTAIKKTSDDMLATARQAGRRLMSDTSIDSAEAVTAAQRVASRLTTAVKQHGAEHLAKTELDNAALVKDAADALRAFAGEAPSVQGAADAVRAVVSGQPGVPGAAGPATKALNEAGARVKAAAAAGPKVSMEPIQEELKRMGGESMPSSLFPRAESAGAPRISIGGEQIKQITPGSALASEQFQKRLAAYQKEVALSDKGPSLPGILGVIQEAPPEIDFADAHVLKGYLDQAVNWDAAARTTREQMTKGIRNALRGAMDYEPYNVATKAYADIVPLYREGIGLAAIEAVAHNPDKVAGLLKATNPQQAAALKTLLIDQSEKGGNKALGQQAWQSVREHFAFQKLTSKGIEGLSDRVQQLVNNSPEFTKAVFGDLAGQQYLSNLDRIGRAYTSAVARASEESAISKAATRTGVARAREIGQAGVQETRHVGEAAAQHAKASADDLLREAEAASDAAKQGVSDLRDRLRTSTINPDAAKSDQINNVRAMVGRGTYRALGLLRLLTTDKGPDMIEWAARSKVNNERLIRALLSPVNDRIVANVIRDSLGLVAEPSHTPTR